MTESAVQRFVDRPLRIFSKASLEENILFCEKMSEFGRQNVEQPLQGLGLITGNRLKIVNDKCEVCV
jgi:hypothetical protein